MLIIVQQIRILWNKKPMLEWYLHQSCGFRGTIVIHKMSTTILILLVVCVSCAYVAADEKCPPNSSRKICGSLCAPTCTNPRPNPRFCPRIVCSSETEGCRCDDGYLKNKNGDCVRPSECP